MLQFLTFDLMNLLQDGPIRLRRVWPLLLGLMCWLDLFGTELLDNSLRIRTELLKGNRSSFSLRDFNLINSLAHQKRAEVNKAPLASNLTSTFLLFKIEETTKRIITATKGVIVPDSPLIKAHITGCDVIHS